MASDDDRYRVAIDAPARRQLNRLPPRIAVAIVDFLAEALPENPLRRSKPLSGELAGLRSVRRGDYRILIEVDESARLVSVVRVAHRSDAYRPR